MTLFLQLSGLQKIILTKSGTKKILVGKSGPSTKKVSHKFRPKINVYYLLIVL